MPGTFRLLQVVRLVRDLPQEQLRKGMVGTVIEVFESPRVAYEVEFVDDRMIRQAFATQAAATMILSPLLTSRDPAGR